MERSHEPPPSLPAWYGVRYPTLENLEAFGWDLGASVVYGRISNGIYFPSNDDYGIPAILAIPDHSSPLAKIWSLSHELGHLVLHLGYTSPWTRAKQETHADRWAACALIPRARILEHGNASLDSSIGALSAHYEDLPLENRQVRRLAGKIAHMRLRALKEVA